MSSQKLTGKIEGISLLRIFCALGVAISHTEFMRSTGYHFGCGVYIFLAITGFLTMYTTQQPRQKYFLLKRVIRIFPVYWVMTILTFLAINLLHFSSFGQTSVAELLKSLFFIPYYRTASTDAGFVLRPIIGPAWSLQFDMYFALLFCIVMKLSHQYRGLLFCLLSLVLILLRDILPMTPLTDLLTRSLWLYFCGGIAVYYLVRFLWDRPSFPGQKLLLSVILIVSCLYLFFVKISVVAVTLILASTILLLKQTKMPGIINWLGDISFSFYLIHYYVVVIVRRFIDFSVVNFFSVLGLLLIVGISIPLAYVSYLVLEKKLGGFLRRKLIG